MRCEASCPPAVGTSLEDRGEVSMLRQEALGSLWIISPFWKYLPLILFFWTGTLAKLLEQSLTDGRNHIEEGGRR